MKLNQHRAMVEKLFHANMQAILKDRRWTEAENAGTAVLAANIAMSHAAFMVAAIEPRLRNAPMEAQIDDFLGLIREVMVKGGKSNPPVTLAVDNAPPSDAKGV